MGTNVSLEKQLLLPQNLILTPEPAYCIFPFQPQFCDGEPST